MVERSRVVSAFCETIRSGKYTAGVYASKNWFKNRLDISKLSADNVTWLAQYADEVTYEGTYQMWQYSSAGRIAGIEGRVDMNLSYLDIDGNRYEKKDEKSEKSNAVGGNKNKEINDDGKQKVESLHERLVGRYLVEDFRDSEGNVVVSKDKLMNDADADKIINAGTKKIKIRSVLTCCAKQGVRAIAIKKRKRRDEKKERVKKQKKW